MIGRNPDVGCASLDHTEHGGEDAANRSDFPTILVAGGGQRIVVPEQFVGAVDQMNMQVHTPTRRHRGADASKRCFLSFVSQCHHWSDLYRPARGTITRQEHDAHEENPDADKSYRIGGRNLEK